MDPQNTVVCLEIRVIKGKWKLFKDLVVEPTTVVDTTDFLIGGDPGCES